MTVFFHLDIIPINAVSYRTYSFSFSGEGGDIHYVLLVTVLIYIPASSC